MNIVEIENDKNKLEDSIQEMVNEFQNKYPEWLVRNIQVVNSKHLNESYIPSRAVILITVSMPNKKFYN